MLAAGEMAAATLAGALGKDTAVREVSCLGRCERAPVAEAGGSFVDARDASAVARALEQSDASSSGALDPPEAWAADVYAGTQDRYGALRAALGAPREALPALLQEAGLRGMGGAGFPTGRKWSLVAGEDAAPKYVVCNADESEPGTFKDRVVLADLAHLVIEGMALAAYAVGAERGHVFLRHEYAPERGRLVAAIGEARRAGALGTHLFGSNFSFDIEVFVSPGGYILGEESALLECMEDRRGEPRNKPPFPGSVGLWGQPTLINNVETFAHVAGIVLRGVEWWRALGREGFVGHKFISVSGDVARPGVYLVPMGIPLGELLERCGGMRAGVELGAIAPGGASSNFLPPDHLDTPLDFETLSDAGSMLGSGAAVFVGAHHDLLRIGLNVTRFFRNESCGKCVPCRVGCEKAVALVEAEAGISSETEVTLRELDATMARTSICGLGQVALGPLISVLENFSPTNSNHSGPVEGRAR
jgi:NADH:ubiquinone oxidoreductase subunit F (NADH-binding)